MRVAATIFVVLFCAGQSLAFGPWDAGEARGVDRQGRQGKARTEHPVFGDPAKVPASGSPAPPLRRDVDIAEHEIENSPNRAATGLSASPLFLAALFYKHFLTKVDGPRCAHLPTCSRFANQAVARHGLTGFLMGFDRLIQDDASSVLRKLPIFEYGGSPRIFDPVDNYVWWRDDFGAFPPPAPEIPLALPKPLTAKVEHRAP